MKRLALLLIALVICLAIYATDTPQNTLIVCFDARAINSIHGEINIVKDEGGNIQLGLPGFDSIARKYGIIDIKRRYPKVLDPEWQSKAGTHLSNVFSLTFKDDSQVSPALMDLQTLVGTPFMVSVSELLWAEKPVTRQINFTPDDPLFPQQWHHEVINTIEMWDYVDHENYLYAYDPDAPEGQQEKEIVIAVVDTGIKWNHPDLKASIWINPLELQGGMTIDWETGVVSGGNDIDEDGNGRADDVIGWSFANPAESNQSYQSYDDNWHGTHVAGCAGAIGNNEIGSVGTAMRVKILPVRCAPDFTYSPSIDNASVALQYATTTALANNLKMIINCSWGGDIQSQEELDVVENAVANGIVVVAAAGNRPADITGMYPADIPCIITVSSVEEDGSYSTWASYGDNVDICAPGSIIIATAYWQGEDDYYAATGTSMASPVAAGVIANLLSLHGYLTPAQVEGIVRDTGTPLSHSLYANGKLGGGRLDAYKMLFYESLPALSLASEITFTDPAHDIPFIGGTALITTSLYNNVGRATATDVTITLLCEVPGVTVSSQNPLIIGDLDPDQTSAPFTFNLNLGLAINSLELPFRLLIQSNQDDASPYPYEREFAFTGRVTISKPGWPFVATGAKNTAPVVHDFGAGKRLVTIINTDLYLIDENCTTQEGFPVSVGSTNASLAIGDVNGDGADEIVMTTTSGNNTQLKVYSSAGSLINSRAFTSTLTRASVIIADLDGNGQNEIVFVSQTPRNIYLLNGSDLTDFGASPISVEGSMNTNLAVGDINGDGAMDIVCVSSTVVTVFNPLTGQALAGFPLALARATNHGPTIANIDGGNDFEIIYGGNANSANCGLFIIKSDGSLLRQTTVSNAISTEVVAVSMAGDGYVQLAFGTRTGNFYIKDHNLVDLPGFPINVGLNIAINGSPVFADMDGDGELECIFGDENGYLHIVKRDATYLPGYPIRVVVGGVSLSPWVGSFASGGDHADILLVSASGVEFVNTQRALGVAVSNGWNMFRANIANTAFNGYQTNSIDDNVALPVVTGLLQNYPNPFNPETVLRFSMAREGLVLIDVFNIRGQKVRTLVSGVYGAGEHSVVWNGVSDTGQSVGSGVYFYRMSASGFTGVRKMLLLK